MVMGMGQSTASGILLNKPLLQISRSSKLLMRALILLVLIIVTSHLVSVIHASNQEELIYDDGTQEEEAYGDVNDQFGVKFTLPSGWTRAKILKVKYYLINPTGLGFAVGVYDSDVKVARALFRNVYSYSPIITGWFEIDLSWANIIVNEEFYIVLEMYYLNKPYLGIDSNGSLYARSFDSFFDSKYWWDSPVNYMIRAIVARESGQTPWGVSATGIVFFLLLITSLIAVINLTKKKWRT
jgi:hypothetical protein